MITTLSLRPEREQKIIYLIRKHCRSNNLIYRYLANYGTQIVESVWNSNIDNFRPAIGPLLKDNFPRTIRVNRHHRGKFNVAKPPSLATKKIDEDGNEYWSTYFNRPAIILKLN